MALSPLDSIVEVNIAYPRVAIDNSRPLRVATFNVERGYYLEKVIKELRVADADVVLLQELDSGCKRTGGVDVANELAVALDMGGIFATEFEELDDPVRGERRAGGGVHGNAVLTRLPILPKSSGFFRHSPQYDWEANGHTEGQPRRGGRVSLWIDVEVNKKVVRCVSTHLENKCGILGRVRQFAEMLPTVFNVSGDNKIYDAVIMGGDLNTLNHGVVRFDFYSQPGDRLRFSTMGLSEAEWWSQNVFQEGNQNNSHLCEQYEELSDLKDGLTLARNLCDPFEKSKDYTMDTQTNWTLWARSFLYNGKLDWILYSSGPDPFLKFSAKNVIETGGSDHCLLLVDFVIENKTEIQ